MWALRIYGFQWKVLVISIIHFSSGYIAGAVTFWKQKYNLLIFEYIIGGYCDNRFRRLSSLLVVFETNDGTKRGWQKNFLIILA